MPFTSPRWKGYMGSHGCVPINTQQTVSMERLAPGEPAPPPKPKPPKPTAEQLKAQRAEAARQKILAQQAKKQELKATPPEQSKPSELEAEECEKPPVFDMLDIPDAMQKMGWPVSAKLARRWFSSAKNIYDDNPNSIQPIDDSSVTLDWTLKFGNVKDKFNRLIAEDIYSDKCIPFAKKNVLKKIHEIFVNQNSSSLSFDTTPFIGDLRKFHIDWQFQLATIGSWNTADGMSINDLIPILIRNANKITCNPGWMVAIN
jgi:hypothetical protein